MEFVHPQYVFFASTPMVPFWGRCIMMLITHFSWDVHWGYDPWPGDETCGLEICGD